MTEPWVWLVVALAVWLLVGLLVAAVMYAKHGAMGDGSEFFAFFWPVIALMWGFEKLVAVLAFVITRMGLVKRDE